MVTVLPSEHRREARLVITKIKNCVQRCSRMHQQDEQELTELEVQTLEHEWKSKKS